MIDITRAIEIEGSPAKPLVFIVSGAAEQPRFQHASVLT